MLQVCNKLLALAASVLLARTLGLDGYGIYAFAIAVTGMGSIVAEMGMGPLTLRETAQAGADQSASIGRQLRGAGKLVVGMGLPVAASGAVILLIAPLAWAEASTLLLSLPLLLLTPFTRIGAATLAGLRRLIASQTFEQAVMPALVAIGAAALYFGPARYATPQNAILVQIAAGALTVAGLALMLRRFFVAVETSPLRSRELAKRGWPFLMIGSALVLNQQLDTLLVGVVLGTAEVGPYRVASQGAQLAMFMAFVINAIISPFVARYHADGDMASLRRLFVYARLVGTVSVGAALGIFALEGERLIALLFGDEFVGAAPLLVILTAGYLGNAAAGPCGTILAMTGHERQSARALWVMAVANGALTTVAGLRFGLYGVAAVTATTIALYQVWLRYILWRELGI